jgi:hypothetical protein
LINRNKGRDEENNGEEEKAYVSFEVMTAAISI